MFCASCGARISQAARFCSECGVVAQDKSFDFAQDKPFDFAQDKPFDFAQDKPFDSAQGRPFDFAQGTLDVAEQPTRFVAVPDKSLPKSGHSAADAPTRFASPSGRAPTSSDGWLSSSDSIDHGRFAPGSIIDDRYRVIGLLGRGGMGEVYRADDLRLGQPVAIKVLPDEVGRDPVRLAQFHNEVRTARQVSHPNVCRVYDVGDIDGRLYLSMEFVDGEDLATSLRRIGRFPEDKATEIARQLCAGIAAIHERGVLHRDLKPANVMLDGDGKVRVMDFGLAVVGPVADVRAGTPAYMAPEQLLGREVTVRSDIFALGLVLYELFTGRRAFTATTIADLVNQHETQSTSSPTTIVGALDPAIERAIMRCLEPEPARRPSSALAVSAALPGGDPLAAALAAGETPSPEMVAAAGEGAGLSVRIAVPAFLAVLAGIAAAYVMAVRTSPLDRIRPQYTTEVLSQKARDAVRAIGYTQPARDEAYGFGWDDKLVGYVRANDSPAPRWDTVLSQRPSPLRFWYRQSRSPLTAAMFHHDLLTAGIVDQEDPPPTLSDMVQLELDHEGRLMHFEAIPPQRLEPAAAPDPKEQGLLPPAPKGPGLLVNWAPLMTLAGLDEAQLQPAEPLWTWLATSDTRAAWTGTWPGGARPLRVEAAALRGRPVAFALIGPWTTGGRTTSESESRETAFVIVIFVLALVMLAGAGLLARKNMRAARGDLRGAFRLACFMTVLLISLWVCQVHLAATPGLFATFLISVCTSVFYGVMVWTIYIALEPFVRRHWPQALVSWTTLLSGRVRDPVVGRDVLFGVAFGVAIALLVKGVQLWTGEDAMSYPGTTDVLVGMRGTIATVLMTAAYAIRSSLFFFFFLFMFRVFLSNQWAAGAAFAVVFALLEALGSQFPLVDGATALIYFSLVAFAVLRSGLVSLAVAFLAANLLLNVPATYDMSAWFAGNMLLIVGVDVALAAWAFHTAIGRRGWVAG